MLTPRGWASPRVDLVKKYGSFERYFVLLFLSSLPELIFFFGAVVSLVQLLRRRAWYLWGVVFAGPLIAWGCAYLEAIQPHLAPWVRDRGTFPGISTIDIGATLLSHALFTTLIRATYAAIPASAPAERRKVLRDRRVGYYLLAPHALAGIVAVVSEWAPAAAATPFLQLPFCAYFASVAFEYRRRARDEWGVVKEGEGEEEEVGEEEEEEEEEGVGRRPPAGRLLDGVAGAAGAMAVRSIMGIVAVAFGIYTRSTLYPVALVWAIVCDNIALLVCFRVFWRAHPGLYLPPQLLTLRFNRKARSSFAAIELE